MKEFLADWGTKYYTYEGIDRVILFFYPIKNIYWALKIGPGTIIVYVESKP